MTDGRATNQCDLLVCADMAFLDGRVFHDAAVAICDGTITACGDRGDIAEQFEARETLRLTDAFLLPGLINAHTHLPMTLLRGVGDDRPLLQWLREDIWPVEGRLSPELLRLGAALGCAEMIRTGCTAFMNGYFHEENTGRAAHDAGIRAVLGEGFFGFPSPMFPDAESCWTTLRRLRQQYSGHPRIRTSVAPHAVFTVSPDALTASHTLAAELDLPWQIHLAESPEETTSCVEKHGKRPVELLDSLGILDRRCTLHHCVDVSEEDIGRLAETGAKVVHNPASNMKLASGIAPIQRMLDAGVTIGLGTDGAASNNQLNMFREMGLAALGGKVRDHDARAASAASVLDMATRGSAQCLHWPELGTLAPGRPADMCALDLCAPNMLPVNDLISHTTYAATGHEVRMTMCEGRVLYLDGNFRTLDLKGLKSEADKARRWISSLRR
ncbi:amidohydrolase family protein [Desulfovibrio oxyclinae]|uniref:amidohydrolase family protein n=1 Tax=Desulfovibrio oxyclinae TaxID=63560 RepID=UPI000375BC1D|nr:amidohydrolase [Desulfovibrio oxyclinae]